MSQTHKQQLATMFITFHLFVKWQLNSWGGGGGGGGGVTLGFHYSINEDGNSTESVINGFIGQKASFTKWLPEKSP